MMKAGFVLLLLILLLNPWTMSWIASGFVVDDGLHPSDAVVALRGDPVEETVRTEEAIKLLQQGYAKTILVDANVEPFFGDHEAQIIEAYLRSKGISDRQMQLCENNADSTAEEARALHRCFERTGARQVIVVTSEYHTRRARFIFRHELAGSGITVMIHPAYDGFYWDTHWWRRRRWAKTFLLEGVKTVASATEIGIADLNGKLREHKPGATAPANP